MIGYSFLVILSETPACSLLFTFMSQLKVFTFYFQFHQFQDNKKPIVLTQMMIADFRERQRTASRIRNILKRQNYEWQFEVLVYHLMLRLIRTCRSNGSYT